MKQINCAVIGMGVGERHANFYKKFKGTRLKKIFEKDKILVKKLKKKFPLTNFVNNENEIFEDPKIDLVSIASYDNYHYRQIFKAFKYNKHIFVEKPICLKLKELRKIWFYHKKNKKIKISSNLLLRSSPQFKKIKLFNNQKKYGNIFYVEADYNYGRLHKILNGWRNKIPFYSINYGGGVHMVDQILWLLDELPYQVKAEANKIVTKNSKFKFNDFSVALLKFKSGKIAKVSSNFGCNMPHHHAMKIFGTKGSLIHNFKGADFYKSRNKKIKAKNFKINFSKTEKNNVLKSFAKSILEKKEDKIINFRDILNSMLICFAIEKSVKTNRNIKINYNQLKIS
tara:strand:- start:315 stop:1337 length:1023 start_codon:yes stop_codon:yes gene_type:complete